MAAPAPAPPLPPGRRVHLPGRGTTFVREVEGPPGAPTLLLLHGWTASADLNWHACYGPLGRRFRVLALDHRGHGRGMRPHRGFRMRDCADDAAALVEVVGTGPVVAVGYSMGGPIAQLLWRRHPEVVRGIVLCATSRSFAGSRQEELWFLAMGTLALAARATPRALHQRVADRLMAPPAGQATEAWVLEELERHDWTAILQAGRRIGRFDSRAWIGEVDVPTAVVVTTQDHVVPPARQLALARSIPGATVHPVPGDHTVVARHPSRFVPALLDACASVVRRAPAPA